MTAPGVSMEILFKNFGMHLVRQLAIHSQQF